MAALVVVGLGIHAWFAVGADALDTNRSLVLLMARHFARGEFSIFFWRQNYMGALEPLLLTPLALLGRADPVPAAFVGIAVTAALAWLSVALARRLGGSAWVALLLWAIPPAVVVHHHVALYGARLVATLLSVGAFTLALRARSPRAWLAAGLLTGIAYFGDHIMLVWAAATLYVAARKGGLRALASGALPIVALDTIAAVMTPAVHLAGPNDPGGWLGNIPLLFGTVLPQLFGLLLGRAPGPLFEASPSVIPEGATWLLFALPGAAVLVALLVTLARGRREVFATDSHEGLAARGLLLACATGLALFGLVGGGGDRWPVRYLVPLWPAVSVLAALAVARWRGLLRPAAALIALPALFALHADRSWPRGADGEIAREEAAAVGRAVENVGARAVWADYWDTYRMALLVRETPRWLTLRIIERRPDWVEEAVAGSPVAYLLRKGDTELLDLLTRADADGSAHIRSSSDVGRYRLVTTDRAVPDAVLMQVPPTRGWQRLAALAAGGLFVGVLIALALVTGALRNPLTTDSRRSSGPGSSSAPPRP